jgi:hypothetical protein
MARASDDAAPKTMLSMSSLQRPASTGQKRIDAQNG